MYDGEISKFGDKVIIRQVPDVTINNYTKGMNLTIERPTDTVVELDIDQGKYWNTILDDVDKIQSDINLMDKFAEDATEQMKIAVDTDVLGSIYSDAAAANMGATAGRISGNIDLGAAGAPITLNKVNILDFIVDLGTVLDEQNVPETGRCLVLPVWACGMIKKSDSIESPTAQ